MGTNIFLYTGTSYKHSRFTITEVPTLALTSMSNEAFIIWYCLEESAIFVSAVNLVSINCLSHSASCYKSYQ